VLKRGRDTSAIEERIRAAIDEVRSLIRIDTAGIELVRYDAGTGTASLRFTGDCPDCEASIAIFLQGISAHLRTRVPEVREVLDVTNGNE
jgi:Fe-S cluster biogenesis protein NfuA